MTEKKKDAEGAPKTETPENPVAPPKDAPRDTESPLGTPEEPALTFGEEALADLRKEDLKEQAAARDLPVSGTKAELVDRLVEQAQDEAEALESRLEQESLHVSISPVNSHAPVWLPREPNSP